MSARRIWMTRDVAELIVDLLECNYKRGECGLWHAGEGADYAVHLRKEFGMIPAPEIRYGEFKLHELLKQELEKELHQRFSDELIKRLISALYPDGITPASLTTTLSKTDHV